MFLVTSDKNNSNKNNKKYLFISTIESSNIEQKSDKEITNQIPLFTAPNSMKKQNFEKQKNSVKTQKRIFFNLYKMNLIDNGKEIKKQKQLKLRKNFPNKKIVNIKLKQNKSNITNENDSNKDYSTGRWGKDEHQRFIDGIIKFGNNWRLVQKYIGTRTGTQIRSHAQKFFEKLKRSKIFKKGEYDLSKNSLKLLYEIISNLSEKHQEQATKKLYSLPYEINSKSNNLEKNESNDELNFFNNDENSQINKNNKKEENNEKNKFINTKDYYYIEKSENINNKLYNNNYLVYDDNDYLFNYEYYNFGIRSRKGSEIFNNQRKNSLTELNDIKNEIKNFEEYNEYIDSNIDINEDEEKTLKNQFNNLMNSFSQNSSRKMSFEEKIIASVY